jgi:hypothetical protein
MHLTIDMRPAKLGKSINTRTEMHGEETVTALDIPLAGILLDAEELNALLGDPKAHACFFSLIVGDQTRPRFPSLSGLQLDGKFAECYVELALGIGDPMLLENVKVASVVLTPLPGGLTELRCKVQCTPDLALAPRLLKYIGQSIDASIVLGEAMRKGEDAQPELPLNSFGAGERPQ